MLRQDELRVSSDHTRDWLSGGVLASTACALALAALALSGCADSRKVSSRGSSKYGVAASPRVVQPGQPVPKGGGRYQVGKPYVVGGRTYFPQENRRYRAEGVASWYGDDFHGRLTANGEVYDMQGISAAHPTLPIPSYARVTNLRNGRSIIVRVNDRGPYHNDRLIDLSAKAADLLQFHRHGTAKVRVEYVGEASLDGSDDRRLMATLSQGRPAPMPSTVRLAAPRSFVPERAPVRVAAAPRQREDVESDEDALASARAALRRSAPAEPSTVGGARGLY